ncbi:MAG: hypothetical protein P8X82_00315, partial [Gemmatimonadales bacterium]
MVNKRVIREHLLRDPVILAAMSEHRKAKNSSEEKTRRNVEQYVDEIVPFFDVLSYYKLGYNIAR